MAWAEGSLWVGQHRKRKIHQVDPQTGAMTVLDKRNGYLWQPGSEAPTSTAKVTIRPAATPGGPIDAAAAPTITLTPDMALEKQPGARPTVSAKACSRCVAIPASIGPPGVAAGLIVTFAVEVGASLPGCHR